MRSFDPFPALETPRLFLRRLVLADADALFRIQSDPVVVRYLGRAPLTRAESDERFFDVEAGIQAHQLIRWGIVARDADLLIGTCSFWRWEKKHFHAEIGYELLPAFWGRGLTTEALQVMASFGFDAMDLHRIEANVDPQNLASIRVLEKAGFVREGTLRQNWHYDGRFIDTATFGLLRGDFVAK